MKLFKIFGLTLALCSAVMFGTAHAASIGVSYAGDNGGGTGIQITTAQTAGVGAVAQAEWNAADGVSGALADLNDDSGSATTADVEWTSPNTWGGSGATSDDEAMVNGWLDDGGASGSLTTVTDIPYARYDVYVYGSSDDGNAGRGWAVTINGTQVGSAPGAFSSLSANGSYFDGSTYFNAASGSDNPTYAVLTGQSGDLTIIGARATVNGLDSRGAVSGFQIVEVPEPASILLGLSAAVFGFVSRRRS